MKQIDFSKFPLIQGLGGEVKEMDIKNYFADAMYTKGVGIYCHALALKIYHSTGIVELDTGEIRTLMGFAEQMCSPNFIDSLNKILAD